MADSEVAAKHFPHAKNLLKLTDFTTKLDYHLKDSMDEMVAYQAKLKNLIEKQWHMKGSLKPMMIYAEMSKQLALDPELWMTQEELDQKSSEVLEEYRKEKDKYKQLSEEVEDISAIFDEAETVSQQEEDVLLKLKEIRSKRKKLEAYEKQFSACPEWFMKLCRTRDQADELIREKRRELEEKRKEAVLERSLAETELNLENAEMALLKEVEKFVSAASARVTLRDQLQFRMEMTSKLHN